MIKKGLPHLLQAHFEDAKAFYEIRQRIILKHNMQLPKPARWVIGQTTSGSFTIEYGTELTKYPEWVIRFIAFHETCHIKHALAGLPCFFLKSDNEIIKDEKISNLKLHEVDLKEFSRGLGMEAKDAEKLLQLAVVVATDFLVNSELIASSPVQNETIRFGIVTVAGNYHMLQSKSTLLAGFAESGMWDAIISNVGAVVPARLLQPLISGVQKVRNAVNRYYGLSNKSYENYLCTLSPTKTDRGQDFFCQIKDIAKTLLSVQEDTGASIIF